MSQVPLRKHICTLSAVRINTRLFSLSQGAVMGRGDLMDPIQVCSIYIILRLRDGHLSSLDAFPESLIRRKSSKKTNGIFILLPSYRQANKQGKKEKVIWWTSVAQDWGLGPHILLCLSSFS